MKASTLLLPLSLATAIAAQEAAPLDAVTTPPKAEVERLTLDAFYQRYCSAGGVPIVASSKVSSRSTSAMWWIACANSCSRIDSSK